MHRLSGEDAGFLYMDLPGQPMSSMGLGVLEPSATPMSIANLREHVASRLDVLPSWRWRIVRVPRDLHHPVAYVPGEPDLEHHVREATVPGGPQELDAFFASVAEEHLDPDLPLWQMWLVHGQDDGSQAVIVKYHHALADGVGAVTTFVRAFSDHELPAPYGAGPARSEPRPGNVPLVLGALWAHLVTLLTLLPLVLRTVRGSRAVKERRDQATVEMPGYSKGAPRTLLNDFVPARRYLRCDLAMAELREIKEAAGVTLNDVVLGVVAGACVRYLAEIQPEFDPSAERPLLTTVPMAFEAPDAPLRQHGNRFWSFTTSLATDVGDPWQRLKIISATSREGKAQLEALGPDLVPDWLDRLPPALAKRGVLGVLERLQADEADADTSILVSNIRGPAEQLSLGGRAYTSIHVDGPPSNGVGINVMMWSYAGEVALGILGYAGALAHPERFGAAISESLDELLTLARASQDEQVA